jgi:hypothetical protein
VPSEAKEEEKKSNGKEESLFSVFRQEEGQTGTKRRSIGIEYK